MPLSESLTSSLLSMMSFWEEGAQRKEGLRRSQPEPGCVGSLEFSQLLREDNNQMLYEVSCGSMLKDGERKCGLCLWNDLG